jgi:hypothetical protein
MNFLKLRIENIVNSTKEYFVDLISRESEEEIIEENSQENKNIGSRPISSR